MVGSSNINIPASKFFMEIWAKFTNEFEPLVNYPSSIDKVFDFKWCLDPPKNRETDSQRRDMDSSEISSVQRLNTKPD